MKTVHYTTLMYDSMKAKHVFKSINVFFDTIQGPHYLLGNGAKGPQVGEFCVVLKKLGNID